MNPIADLLPNPKDKIITEHSSHLKWHQAMIT